MEKRPGDRKAQAVEEKTVWDIEERKRRSGGNNTRAL